MTQRTCRPVPLQVRVDRIKQRRFGRALNRAYLAGFEKRYKKGHKVALLDLIDGCLRTGRKVPLWAAQLFCDCYLDFASGLVQTLDQAFGIPPTTSRKFEARRTHNQLRPKAVYRVMQLSLIENMSMGEALFGQVARELRTSEGTVRRVYYDKASKTLKKLFATFREFSTKPLAKEIYA
jgi:putative component of toxin-antitoxin plasmid stabilization module